MTDGLVLLILSIAVPAWTIGLVTFLAYSDASARRQALEHVLQSLSVLLVRRGDSRRSEADTFEPVAVGPFDRG